MKNQKIFSIAIIIIVVMFSSSIANEIDDRIDKLNEELNLSSEQSSQIQQILENTKDSADKKSVDRQIEQVLSNEQRRQFHEFCRSEDFFTTLNEKLELSEEQKEQIQSIIASTSEEMKQLHDGNKSDRHAMMESMKNIMEERDSKIKSILNDEQKSEFDKINAEQRQNEQNNRPPRQGRRGRP